MTLLKSFTSGMLFLQGNVSYKQLVFLATSLVTFINGNIKLSFSLYECEEKKTPLMLENLSWEMTRKIKKRYTFTVTCH